jgi:hypothetical protein
MIAVEGRAAMSDIEVRRFDPVQETAARLAFSALFKQPEKRTAAEANALRILLGKTEEAAA